MAVIDTSASMSVSTLEVVAAELAMMAKTHTVTVVECDAAIHAVYPFRDRLSCVHGRGGTDFRPVFAQSLLKHIKPDCIVVLTDGEGPAPDHTPAIPVVWCLTPDGTPPAPWGRVVRLPND
jgi:predicted metal-dependent peptidase